MINKIPLWKHIVKQKKKIIQEKFRNKIDLIFNISKFAFRNIR